MAMLSTTNIEEEMGLRKKDMVTITCYGKTESRDRNEAMQFYMDCAQNSEGHERNRYFNILTDLMDGKTKCSDRNGDY